MNAQTFKQEALILTADVEIWKELLDLLDKEEVRYVPLADQLRYKLWRTRHLDSPLPV